MLKRFLAFNFMCTTTKCKNCTLWKTDSSTRRDNNANTYLFLFSRQQLSNWRFKTGGKPNRWLIISRVWRMIFMVKLLSCFHWNMSKKPKYDFPIGHNPLCTIAPVRCVRSFWRFAVDFDMRRTLGVSVFYWSMPSKIMVRYFSGCFLAL